MSIHDLWEQLTPIEEVGMTEESSRIGIRFYALESLAKNNQTLSLSADLTKVVALLSQWSTTHALHKLHALNPSPSQQPWYFEWILVDNATMQELNNHGRGQDKPTDVLSFPTLENAVHGDDHADCVTATPVESVLPESLMNAMRQQGGPLGSVIVSLDYAQEAVQHSAQVLDRYILERFIHGSLHNMGQHHATQDDYQRVLALQQDFFHRYTRLYPL